MKLLKFEQPECNDVVTGLRNLANGIEAGSFGDAHNLAWVVDCGNGDVEIGLLGEAKEAGAELFLLLAMGTHKIISGVTNQ